MAEAIASFQTLRWVKHNRATRVVILIVCLTVVLPIQAV